MKQRGGQEALARQEGKMKEVRGNIWDFYNKGHWIVITTNGTVKATGEAIMGKGVALQAKRRFPRLPKELGARLKGCAMPYGKFSRGNDMKIFYQYNIITFPVKHQWFQEADLALIEESCRQLQVGCHGNIDTKYMVRPGCGNGGLDWKDVKPILEKYLDDRFVVVEW